MTSTELTPTMPTQRLLSGLYVPADLGETTAPLDVVDRTQPEPAPKSEPEPIEQPRPEPPAPSPAPVEVFRPSPPTPSPVPVATSTTTPPPALPASAKTKKTSDKGDDKDDEITTGAFVAVCAVTVAVAGLAFALSFDMMLTAARHYGWGDNLSKLFPIIIDVGAIGGTFMGAISANRVYRQIGHQVLIVTLAASVLFNLVGHDIRGKGVAGLPEGWAWTGTVAAVLIPMLLAYFVHAFSKALKTYTDQRRAAAEQAKQDQDRTDLLSTPTPTPTPTRPAAPNPRPAVKPTSKPKRKGNVASKEDAVKVGIEKGATTPSALKAALVSAGYALPKSQTTVENWCRAIREKRASAQ